MMKANFKLILIISCSIMLAAGCASPVDHKSPKELLSLSVAGLSGIDRYTFSGQTGIETEDRVEVKSTAFQGTVENHNQVQVKSNEVGALTGIIRNPLELLTQVQASAKKTELLKGESGEWTAVLAITSDEKTAAEMWRNNLKEQFKQIAKKMPASAKGNLIKAKSQSARDTFTHEWKEELIRSGAEFNQMLSTLHVNSSYRLVVDRKRLVPLKLEENSVLHYRTSDGEYHTESRKTQMTIQMLGKQQR